MEKLLARYCRQLRLGSNILENAGKIQSKSNMEFLTELFRLEIESR